MSSCQKHFFWYIQWFRKAAAGLAKKDVLLSQSCNLAEKICSCFRSGWMGKLSFLILTSEIRCKRKVTGENNSWVSRKYYFPFWLEMNTWIQMSLSLSSHLIGIWNNFLNPCCGRTGRHLSTRTLVFLLVCFVFWVSTLENEEEKREEACVNYEKSIRNCSSVLI